MAEQGMKKSRGWRIVLAISLALNMAVVGIVAGFALRGKQNGPPQRFDLSLGPIGAALSREDRRNISRELRNNHDLRRSRNGEMPQVIADLIAALRQDPPDAEALRAAAHAPAMRMMVVQRAASEALADRIMAMSPTGRADLADRIEDQSRRRRR